MPRSARTRPSRIQALSPSSLAFLILALVAGLACVVGVAKEQDESLAPIPLDLDPFEDDDCLEVPHAEVLLRLMHEMSELLEHILWSDASGSEEIAVAGREGKAWTAFDAWSEAHFSTMIKLVGPVLGRPYCEPGKVAWMAAECLLLLRQGGEAAGEEALSCAAALDEDLLAQMTPRSERFNTRIHLVLRSPWPALRLLDLLVRLHPERGTTRMGACKGFRKWNSDPDIFDWPWFKPLVKMAADTVTSDPRLLELRPEDGPLSRQYRARWLRVRSNRELRQAITFSDDVFENYREHHYKAGCHLGVISSYILQMLLVHLRDIEGRLHRYSASVAQLINLHAPFSYIVQSDWAPFRLLYLVHLLQRAPPRDVWQGGPSEVRAKPDAAKVLCANVEEALTGTTSTAYVTAAWGHLATYAGSVLTRWAALFGAKDAKSSASPIIFLALDVEASRQCSDARANLGDYMEADVVDDGRSLLRCIDAPRHLGIEGAIAKYLALASISRRGVNAVWLDLDVFVLRDPTPQIGEALAGGEGGPKDVVFARHLMSESLSPTVVAARGSPEATDLLMRYACWLRENAFLLDHQGWDQFLDNRAGDYQGGYDYQGRNSTVKDDGGPSLSFLPKEGAAPPVTRYGTLGSEFGSGDGWLGNDAESLALFHFWGADETQSSLFDLFYPHSPCGVPQRALRVLEQYRRQPSSPPQLNAIIGRGRGGIGGGGGKPLHLVSVSYAHGCCQKSLLKNRRQALKVGVDDARAYGKRDLSPAWAQKHDDILSQRRGGGWWLWKPYIILQALKDPSVPWSRGVVMWVDAGNYLQDDPRPLIYSALRNSDIAAMRLKFCLEDEWTSEQTLRLLNVSERYAITERPQLGAYFLMFRKTQVSISFVEEWLRKSEDGDILRGGPNSVDGIDDAAAAPTEVPGFQKHQADQSIFSVLFKDYGFNAASLEEGHKIVKLARWRE